VSKQRRKGTDLEVQVEEAAKDYGYLAMRIAHAGRYDKGDVHIYDGSGSLHVIECKNTPNNLDIPGALRELAAEKEHAGAMFGAVVFKRKGTTDVGRYYTVMEFADYLALLKEPGF